MKSKLYIMTAFVFCFVHFSLSKSTARITPNYENMTTESIKLKITINNKIATAVLNNSNASKDFISLLPLEVKLDDYANTEKVVNLPIKLSTKDAPNGFVPSIGDITYYAPWGNLAIFYKDFGYASGLVSLGKVTTGIDVFSIKGSVHAKIEIDN